MIVIANWRCLAEGGLPDAPSNGAVYLGNCAPTLQRTASARILELPFIEGVQVLVNGFNLMGVSVQF